VSKINVLFVCLGNICRSPTAEGVFRALVESEGLAASFHIDSAGTSGWHKGELPDPRSMKEALRHGVDLSSQRSRAVEDRDFNKFHYIVAMDYANLKELKKRCPENLQDRLKLFTSFAPELGIAEVPDPYYDGPQGFTHVFRIAEASAKGLLQAIVRDRALA
jgi:protein-tyrosine phosphatase